MQNANWRDGLSEDQANAAAHLGSHARLLAGPGTGKTRTLTRRILNLALDADVLPEEILALTFTRMAASQLREEIRSVLEPQSLGLPRVSTLHSFALRQLTQNAPIVAGLPTPLLIADDWEERFIIQEDLKKALGFERVTQVQALLNELSSGFETLRHDDIEAGQLNFPDPRFLGVWGTHRQLFGYTLRAELVYQLKRALERHPEFRLETDFKHLLVDEYQDLNACDLSIIHSLVQRGLELYAAGDDDQSIYGFRFADPTGIRQFVEQFPASSSLSLEICFRCDKRILQIAEFVAAQDHRRLPKPTRPRDDAGEGLVEFHSFRDQYQEASWVAETCRDLIASGSAADSILLLLRSDLNKSISGPVVSAFEQRGIRVAQQLDNSPLEDQQGRTFLSYLRLLSNEQDSLAWRTLLQILPNQVGEATLEALREHAQRENLNFSEVVRLVEQRPEIIQRGKIASQAVKQILEVIDQFSSLRENAVELLNSLALQVIDGGEERDSILQFFAPILESDPNISLASLLGSINASLTLGEQEMTPGAVNLMTMHKAKGLSADNVIIVGAEDQFIPGRGEGEMEGDERRLLYVSMTRARHRLLITFCRTRIDEQRFSGRESGNPRRRITRFLEHNPYLTIAH